MPSVPYCLAPAGRLSARRPCESKSRRRKVCRPWTVARTFPPPKKANVIGGERGSISIALVAGDGLETNPGAVVRVMSFS